uniref:Putative ovule protein n=1 Tax=Solanum chacoense TaxID=4108 RepID=A0A0V0HKR3_SOLCH
MNIGEKYISQTWKLKSLIERDNEYVELEICLMLIFYTRFSPQMFVPRDRSHVEHEICNFKYTVKN